jgi:hypothetical protein
MSFDVNALSDENPERKLQTLGVLWFHRATVLLQHFKNVSTWIDRDTIADLLSVSCGFTSQTVTIMKHHQHRLKLHFYYREVQQFATCHRPVVLDYHLSRPVHHRKRATRICSRIALKIVVMGLFQSSGVVTKKSSLLIYEKCTPSMIWDVGWTRQRLDFHTLRESWDCIEAWGRAFFIWITRSFSVFQWPWEELSVMKIGTTWFQKHDSWES